MSDQLILSFPLSLLQRINHFISLVLHDSDPNKEVRTVPLYVERG